MRFLHLSDLHIGKRVNDFSMIEDQRYILKQILDIIDNNKVDAIIIAGDIYDKSIPSTEAITLFDEFISDVSKRDKIIFAISGNHDSAERIAFGSSILNNSGIYFSPVFNGEIKPIILKDNIGEINVYMLPFIKPVNVKRAYEKDDINTYNEAVRCVIDKMDIDSSKRNVLIVHQLVTGATRCESEDISVGGIDNVDADNFEKFDYVALGHIHGPQKIGNEYIRYCGTPLKYSFSECNHKKAALIVDMEYKGDIKIEQILYRPLRDMRKIKGTYLELIDRNNYKDTNTEDYISVTLTDEEDVLDAVSKLRIIYPNILQLEYENKRTKSKQIIETEGKVELMTPIELLDEFYEKQNNQKLSKEQKEYVHKIMEKIWEEDA